MEKQPQCTSKQPPTMEKSPKRSPKILKDLLTRTLDTDSTPNSTIAASMARGKRLLMTSVGDGYSNSRDSDSVGKKRKTEREFLESAMKAVQEDKEACDLLDVVLCPVNGDAHKLAVVVTTKMLYHHEPVKYVPRLRLVLSGDGSYYIQVLFRTFEEGTISTLNEFSHLCQKLSDSINYKFCPGIGVEEYQSYKDKIKYDPKRVAIIDSPVRRIESVNCKRWYLLNRSSVSRSKRESPEVTCSECTILRNYLARSAKKLANLDPKKELEHLKAASSFPKKYLSPESLKIRNANIEAAKVRQKRLLKKYIPKEVLDEDVVLLDSEKSQVHATLGIEVSSELVKKEEDRGAKVESALIRVLKQDTH